MTYPVFERTLEPLNDKTLIVDKGRAVTVNWHRAVLVQVGYAESMADAKAKFGGAPMLGEREKS